MRPEDQSPVKEGDVLGGKFRVERVLGSGGMGMVVAATHLQLQQTVALKFMHKEALAVKDHVARFEREARAAVRLKSEHVARVTDVGKLDDGAPYMVMEFLEGTDLDIALAEQGPLPIPTAVDYVLQASEAVLEAHTLGIVHRDLKPKNLFLTRGVSGRPLVKVLDFGISKIMDEGDMSLTGTTQILGSPNYMAPEQLRSTKDVDQRADIWALGTILFELLTGEVPFKAETVTQLTAMVIADEPQDIEKLRPDVPFDLRRAIMRCLEKKRDERFQSVREFAQAIMSHAPAEYQHGYAEMFGDTSRLSTTGGSRRSPSGPPNASSGKLPSERPSFRAAGANTDVAWDQTQAANTMTSGGSKKASRTPLIAGSVAVIAVVGGIILWRTMTTSPTAPAAALAPQTTQATAAKTATEKETVAPSTTVTQAPSALTTKVTTQAHATIVAPTATQGTPSATVVAPPTHTTPPPASVTATPSSTGDLLPNVRN